MLKSRSQQDKDTYREVCNNYSMSLKNAKQRYYSDLTEECGGDTRKLFQVVRSLCNKPEENQLPLHDVPCKLADDFGEFFCRKVDLIRNDIDAITVVPPVLNVPTPEIKFEKFDVLSEEEVSDIIMGSSNASCQLDPIPTWLLKLCGSELIPVITKMINLSLQQGQVPDSWKAALIRPLLKKLGLELVYKNFRPVSNLPMVSKSAEKAVVGQLFRHCSDNAPLPVHQSSYRQFHSTETVLLKVQSDILSNMDKQEVTLLVLLDLSAAFDTVDHNILESDFGICGDVLKWFRSYLTGRVQRVIGNQQSTKTFNLNYGVPQGSCLRPVLFQLYAARLFEVVKKHLPSVHGYAYGTQLYVSFRPDSFAAQDQAIKAIENYIADVRAWLVSHRLMFNDSKTEFLIIGSSQQLSKVTMASIKVGDCDIPGLDVATCGVANATRFYSLATNFSRLVARLAPRFFDLVLKFLIEFNTLILSCSRMKPMKSCSILLLATLFTC